MSSDDTILNNRLMSIENLLSSASALNGGFDKLMIEIAHIKSGQEELQAAIKKISEAMYDPSIGVLAKVREAEIRLIDHEKFEEQLLPVIDRHKEISLWIVARDKDLEKWTDKRTDIIIEMDRLTQWKNNVTRLLWLIGASTVGLLVKTFFSILDQ
jgi:hypothetical protein